MIVCGILKTSRNACRRSHAAQAKFRSGGLGLRVQRAHDNLRLNHEVSDS